MFLQSSVTLRPSHASAVGSRSGVSAGRRVGAQPASRSSFSSGGSGPDRIIKRLAGQSREKDVTQESHCGDSANGSRCGVLWGL